MHAHTTNVHLSTDVVFAACGEAVYEDCAECNDDGCTACTGTLVPGESACISK